MENKKSEIASQSNKEDSSFLDKFLSSKLNIILIIVLIFILGFAARSHLLKYDYMFEFDTYWHLRATEYTVKGELGSGDPLGYYNDRGIEDQSYSRQPKLLWYFTAFVYTVFTLGSGFNKFLLMDFARLMPVIFGALISVLMYLLGKELFNKKAGIAMGIVAATIPAFVYRTMAGFYEEDAFGFLWLVAGFIYLAKATKNMENTRKHLTQTLIACVFFSLMIITWKAYLLIPLIVGFYFGIKRLFLPRLLFSAQNGFYLLVYAVYVFHGFSVCRFFAFPAVDKCRGNYHQTVPQMVKNQEFAAQQKYRLGELKRVG